MHSHLDTVAKTIAAWKVNQEGTSGESQDAFHPSSTGLHVPKGT